MRTRLFILVLLLSTLPALGQASASFRLSEHSFNEGGHPSAGTAPASASFRISLGSIGGGPTGRGLASASFRMDGGFVSAYLPPGETHGLHLSDHETLVWDAEPSAVSYDLYRGLLGSLPGLDYGDCWTQDIAGLAATDADPLGAGTGFFYLVTATNRLGEGGTKGFQSNSSERTGSACP